MNAAGGCGELLPINAIKPQARDRRAGHQRRLRGRRAVRACGAMVATCRGGWKLPEGARRGPADVLDSRDAQLAGVCGRRVCSKPRLTQLLPAHRLRARARTTWREARGQAARLCHAAARDGGHELLAAALVASASASAPAPAGGGGASAGGGASVRKGRRRTRRVRWRRHARLQRHTGRARCSANHPWLWVDVLTRVAGGTLVCMRVRAMLLFAVQLVVRPGVPRHLQATALLLRWQRRR
jgi:hypothetical protein